MASGSGTSNRQPRAGSAPGSKERWLKAKQAQRGSLPTHGFSISSAVSLISVTTVKPTARFKDEMGKERERKKKKKINLAVFELYEYNKLGVSCFWMQFVLPITQQHIH